MIKNRLVLFLVVMMVSSCCMPWPRMMAVGRIFDQEQWQHHVEKGVATMEGRNRAAKTSAKSTDNHHNIPRQDWGNDSPPADDGNGDGGSG
ncbi:hypothetical protein SLEP1_g48549 [Rubroshorea leprosula]|uniref:Uncharacterized protein n=1 Tax=Rubroshorea leprosula TaxID=152421 RepID=A0AAV5LU62_9ROSI|nr:hypothetical protein SLEP1_g48549 [Rubroshorea leprosula]